MNSKQYSRQRHTHIAQYELTQYVHVMSSTQSHWTAILIGLHGLMTLMTHATRTFHPYAHNAVELAVHTHLHSLRLRPLPLCLSVQLLMLRLLCLSISIRLVKLLLQRGQRLKWRYPKGNSQ